MDFSHATDVVARIRTAASLFARQEIAQKSLKNTCRPLPAYSSHGALVHKLY